MHCVVICGGVLFSSASIQMSAATNSPDTAMHSAVAASGPSLPLSTSQPPLEVSYIVAMHFHFSYHLFHHISMMCRVELLARV